jgi:hypothetical protein
MNGILLDLLLLSAKSAPFIALGCVALWLLRRFVIATERRILSTEDLEGLRERCVNLEHQVDEANNSVAPLTESHTFMMQLLAEKSDSARPAVTADSEPRHAESVVR